MLGDGELGQGKLVGRYLAIALLVGAYNTYLVPYMPPTLSLIIGLIGLGAMVLFFIELVAWIAKKSKRDKSKNG